MARSRRMHDMARRMRDRRRDMRDRRNPYGSQGGYVSSSKRDRTMGDYNYDMARGRYYDGTEHYDRYDTASYPDHNYSEYDMYYEPSRERYRRSNYGWSNIMNDFRGRRDYRYDRASESEYLSDEELMEWSKDLMEDIEPSFKPQFERNRVIQRAKEMGVNFKDFSEDEYYVTVLMIATDYGKTIGMNNVDQMFRMAVDWLQDDDSELQGGEKLATYYDEIICAE